MTRLAWLSASLVLLVVLVVPADVTRASSRQVSRTPQPAAAQPQTKPPATPSDGRGDQRPGSPGQNRDRTPWWQDEAIKKELGLTEQVARDIERIYRDREKQIAHYLTERERAREELNAMMAARVVEPDVIALKAERLETLNARIAESRWVMLYKMYRKLTPDQAKKLDEIFRRNSRGGGRGQR
jgi:Spy/CpxP family protein refolding chaperone